MAGTKYPPQGPLNVRRRESGLAKYGGHAADDLARLLELATEDDARYRPTMSELRDELRTWLQLHPPGTTPRPGPSRFRTTFDECLSPRALDEAGRDRVLADAVRRLLDGCRDASAGGSRLVDDLDANIGPSEDPRSGGNPDWIPDQVVIKKLGWEAAAGVRLVGVGVLDGEDDLRYDLSWQVRTPGTVQWELTWRAGGRVRMRLPSDIAERLRLRDEAFRHIPSQLADPATSVSTETESRLRQVANEVRRRESRRGADMDEARRRVAGREQAAERAMADWQRFWNSFVEYVTSVVDPDVALTADHRDDDWFLIMGDRRLVVRVRKPATHLSPAVLLGTVTVESEDPDRYRSSVANLTAVLDDRSEPAWHLLRLERNQLASPPVPVSEALRGALGAVSLNILEELLRDGSLGIAYPAARIVSTVDLNVDNLLAVVVAEIEALDQRARQRET